MTITIRELPRVRISDAVPPPAAPEPEISTALMLIRERAIHLPLLEWAEGLRRGLARVRQGSRTVYELAYEFSRAGNNAALIAVHQGEGPTAASLVKSQLRWINRLIRRSGATAIADFAVSPWTNHARLDTFRGDWGAALQRMRSIEECRRTDTLRLGGGPRTPALSLATPGRDGYKRYLRDLYVTESLKALLANRQWQGALDFAAGLDDAEPEWIARSADEARVVALCRLGDHERAEAMALRAIRLARGWDGAALRVRRAEVLACDGRRDRAEAALEGLRPAVCAAPIEAADTMRALNALYPLLRAASLGIGLGMEATGAALAERAFHVAAASEDEVFQIESARLLARAGAAAERPRWAETAERLETETLYRRFRRGPVDSERAAVLHALYEEVAAAFD